MKMEIKTEITVRCKYCREELPAELCEGDEGEVYIELDTEKLKKHKCK
jgi:hypothetical protein